MKKLILFLFIFILITSLWAEEDPEETKAEKPSKGGGFGGPVLKVTRINDVFGLMIGGRGGWIYKHTYSIGGGLYGLLRDISPPDSNRDYEFAYSGLELEYIVAPSKDVHLSAQTLIGFGGLTDRNQRFYYDRYDYDEYGRFGGPDDTFFIVEPQLNIVWNMKTYLQIYFGGSYRYIRGVEIAGLDNANLRGYSVVVTFRFGRNAKVEPPDQSEYEGTYIF